MQFLSISFQKKKKKIMHFCLLLQFKNNDFFSPKTHSITILMHRLATSLYLYITNKWSIVFNTTVLRLHHVSSHVIPIFFFLFVLQFENGFCKFQNYSNSCIINSSPIINPSPLLIYLLPLSSLTQSLFSLKEKNK